MERKSALIKVASILKSKVEFGKNIEYKVPSIWDTFGYIGEEKKVNQDGTITVNPYNFYLQCIEKVIISNMKENIDYALPLSKVIKEKNNGGDWIKDSSIYGMQIRTSSAWDHDSDGNLELNNKFGFKDTGTFLKTIVLLPLIKKMGFNVIYMLPITKNSTRYAKGEMGSPYAVKNFFEIDPVLKDTMLETTVDEEFRAFVEACHVLGIRVIIDIIPRTSARDSDLILEHPDWFYWIKIKDLDKYHPPKIEGFEPFTKAENSNVERIYNSYEVKEHLKLFVPSPDKIDPQKWESIKQRCSQDKNIDFFELIEKEFEITTAPAFSDSINDPQPPWNDVTYLRLYLDNPKQSSKFVDRDQPPYILFDIIRGNIFKGKIKNIELWNKIADVIPYYQRNFGIDGARIDMGHALPSELERMIIKRPREFDKNFCFISEELNNKSDKKAKRAGYNMIIGEYWWAQPRIKEGYFKKMILQSKKLKLPVIATAETPDTPRAASREGGKAFSKFTVVINNFLPNAVPFVTSGMELFEVQPMNLGLDPQPNGRYMLSKDDPLYGKLAFFDRYALHWNNEGKEDMISILERVSKIREKYLKFLKSNNFINFDLKEPSTFVFAYKLDDFKEKLLLIAANGDFKKCVSLSFKKHKLERKIKQKIQECDILFELIKSKEIFVGKDVDIYLNPGDVKIIIFK